MNKIVVLIRHSTVAVLIASNLLVPLSALPIKPQIKVKRDQRGTNLLEKLKNNLEERGLEKEVASTKVDRLFKNDPQLIKKLTDLYSDKLFSVSREKLIEELAKYALHEKTIDLNSYASLIGLTQRVSDDPLNETQLQYIHKLASSA